VQALPLAGVERLEELRFSCADGRAQTRQEGRSRVGQMERICASVAGVWLPDRQPEAFEVVSHRGHGRAIDLQQVTNLLLAARTCVGHGLQDAVMARFDAKRLEGFLTQRNSALRRFVEQKSTALGERRRSR
jgi:hypothetical protein